MDSDDRASHRVPLGRDGLTSGYTPVGLRPEADIGSEAPTPHGLELHGSDQVALRDLTMTSTLAANKDGAHENLARGYA